jgi:uridine kinase
VLYWRVPDKAILDQEPGDLTPPEPDQTRDEMLGRLAEAIGSVTVAHPTRVAVDGAPAAGKTTLADELAGVLRARGRDVIRATIDDFLFPRARRYPRGEYSAEGCYFDAHDYGALTRVLLDPLGPDGDRRYRPAADHADIIVHNDAPQQPSWETRAQG